MDQERWQRVQELFEAAGALVPEERAAYLEGACSGDDELRREVMALLGRERVPGDPLGDAVAEAAADAVRTGPTSLAAGHRIGRYTILDKLGVGGMGEVYLAEDRELGRQVALKLLGSWIAADERQVRRFQREARALATLSHPNIVTIFSVEHEGDAHFLTMESVRGRRLDQAIGAGEVGLEGFFDIAVPLSAALAAAHRQGITHRDLKPANVMLTAAGEVKVLDFGLAKLKPAATSRAQTVALSATLTRAGVVVGTVPYMSPEQVEGKPVDERSDIFSLGVVFYEMVTGGRPFRGDSEAALISSILTQEPPGIATVDSRVPPRLARIIGRCLAKQPQARYQSATDLLAELEEVADSVESHPKISRGLGWLAALALRVRRWRLALAAAAVLALAAILVSVDFGGPQVDSLAVLPFASLNRDGQQEYLADGMTEVLITELSKIGGLKVISRTSVMPMKDTDLSMTQIAERLGVDAVVEGSVRRSEDRIGVTAKLFHAASGEPLWAESFERDLRDLLALQGELARAIAHQIEVTLTPEEQERLTNREAVDPRAWEAYLRGRNRWRQFSLEEALGEFRQAAEIDPEFALAHAGVATILQMQGAIGFPHPPRVSYPAAREAAARALELEPRLAEAHAVQGWIALNFDFDWPAAAREFGRARELGPGSVDAQRGWSFYLAAMGRHEEAVAASERTEELDPLSPMGLVFRCQILYFARLYDRALFELGERFDESFVPSLWTKERLVQAKGDPEGAAWLALRSARLIPLMRPRVAALEKAMSSPGEPGSRPGAACWRCFWREMIDFHRQWPAESIRAMDVAESYSRLGEADEAFAWLERAYERRDPLAHLGVDPIWDPLRQDPRFDQLLRRLDLPQAAGP